MVLLHTIYKKEAKSRWGEPPPPLREYLSLFLDYLDGQFCQNHDGEINLPGNHFIQHQPKKKVLLLMQDSPYRFHAIPKPALIMRIW